MQAKKTKKIQTHGHQKAFLIHQQNFICAFSCFLCPNKKANNILVEVKVQLEFSHSIEKKNRAELLIVNFNRDLWKVRKELNFGTWIKSSKQSDV